MGWWTRRLADGSARREEQALQKEIERLEEGSPSTRSLMAVGHLQETRGDREAAIDAYRRALTTNEEARGPRWLERRAMERIAACEGAPEGPSTLEIERDGRTVRLDGSVCVLGRSSRTTDILVPSGTVAHEHCVIWLENGDWRLRDLGSTNGTTLDGERIDGTATLDEEAELRLADIVVKVKVLREP